MGVGLRGLHALTSKERGPAIEQAFLNVANTEDGQIMVATMLEEMHFLDRADTPEFQALNNYAKLLLARCGLSSTYRLMAGLMNIHRKE